MLSLIATEVGYKIFGCLANQTEFSYTTNLIAIDCDERYFTPVKPFRWFQRP